MEVVTPNDEAGSDFKDSTSTPTLTGIPTEVRDAILRLLNLDYPSIVLHTYIKTVDRRRSRVFHAPVPSRAGMVGPELRNLRSTCKNLKEDVDTMTSAQAQDTAVSKVVWNVATAPQDLDENAFSEQQYGGYDDRYFLDTTILRDQSSKIKRLTMKVTDGHILDVVPSIDRLLNGFPNLELLYVEFGNPIIISQAESIRRSSASDKRASIKLEAYMRAMQWLRSLSHQYGITVWRTSIDNRTADEDLQTLLQKCTIEVETKFICKSLEQRPQTLSVVLNVQERSIHKTLV